MANANLNSVMCFYDQYRMRCGCHKWGHFRQHCSKEYRTGDTCGLKMIMQLFPKEEKCRICTKINVKRERLIKEEARIARWRGEHRMRSASIEKAVDCIQKLQSEISELEAQRATQRSAKESSSLGRRTSNSSLESSSTSSWESWSTISNESSSTIPIDDEMMDDQEINQRIIRTSSPVNSIKPPDFTRLRSLRTDESLQRVERSLPKARPQRAGFDDIVVDSLNVARMAQFPSHLLSCASQTRSPLPTKTWEKSVVITWQCVCICLLLKKRNCSFD